MSNADSINDDEYGGFAIEFGDLKIDNDDRLGNLEDSASTGTLGIPKPDNFIDPDTLVEEMSQVSQNTPPPTIQEDKNTLINTSNLEEFRNLNLEENKKRDKYPSRFAMTTLKPVGTPPFSRTPNSLGNNKKNYPNPVTPTRDTNKEKIASGTPSPKSTETSTDRSEDMEVSSQSSADEDKPHNTSMKLSPNESIEGKKKKKFKKK